MIKAESSNEGVWVELRKHPQARRLRMRLNALTGALNITVPKGTKRKAIDHFLNREAQWVHRQYTQYAGPLWIEENTLIPIQGILHNIMLTGHVRGLVSQGDPAPSYPAHPTLLVPGYADFVGRKVTQWLKQLATEAINQALAYYVARLNLPVPKFSLRDTKSRWGSCSSGGTLSFSWRLILAPKAVLDYVVAHEVAHLREMNHSPRFWALVQTLKPDYKDQELWLKQSGAELHRYQIRSASTKHTTNIDKIEERFFWPFPKA